MMRILSLRRKGTVFHKGDWATVTENYEAVHDGELTVQKGECVEVLERASNKGDFYHVRVRGGATRPSQNAPLNAGSRKLLDGYLPGAVLALVPHNRSSRHLSPSRTMSIDHNGTEDGFNGSSSTSGSTLPVPISISDRALHSGGDDNGGFTDSGAPSQPVAPTTKRRNTFRKWLTNPVRKLSQNRIDTSGGGGTAGGGKHGSSSSGNLAQLPSISVSSNSNKKSASNTVTSPTSPSPTSTASATPPTATTTATSRVKSLFHSHAHPSAPAGPPPSGLPAAASTGASEDVRRASAPPLAVSEVEDPPLAVGRDDDPSRQHHQLAPHHQKPPLQQQQKSSSKNNVIGAIDAPPTIITAASSSTRTATDLIHDTAITTTGTMPGLSAAALSLPEMPPPMEQIQSMSIPGLISNTLLSAAAAGAGGSSPSSAASPEQSLLQQNRLSSSSLPAVAVLDGHITSTAAVAALSIHHIPNARELAGEIENLAITTQSGGRGSSTSSAAMQQHDVDDTANPHKRSNGVTSAGDSGDSTKKSESEERSSTVTSPVLDAGGEDSIGGDADKKPDSFESAEVIPREPTNEENSMSPDPIVRATTMRDYVLRELVDTERDYVKDLGLIIDGYLTYMHDNAMPDDMNGREKLIFGNIQQIYMFHRDTFCGELEKCLEAADRLPQVFIRFERKFQMYVVYCQNKPKSEFIVSEYIDTYFEDIRLKLGQKLKLPDMLIKPVQRVMRYQLMLKDIVKYTERAQLPVRDLQRAIGCIMGVCKLANDFMEGNLTAQGKLVLQGSFLVCETFTATAPPPGQGGKDKEKEKEKEKDAPANQKFKERQIFVFEQVVIFSEAVGQSQKKSCYSSPIYVYKSQIQVNKMSLIEVASDTVRFALRSRCPHSGDRMFVCEAPDKEKRDLWVTQIKNMLETQQNFLRALQSPIDFQRRAQQGDEVMTDQFPTPPLFASTTTTVTSPTAPPPPTPPHVGDVSRPPLKFHATDVATADRPSPPAADTRFSKFMRPKSYHVDQETPDRRRIFPRLPDSPGGGGSTGMRGYSGACTTPMPVTPPPVPVEEPSSAANANRRFLFPVPSLKVVHSESDLLKRSTLAGGTDGGRNTSALPAPAELLPASSNSSLLVGAETKSSRRWSISGRRDAKPPPASTTPAALPPKDRFSASFRSKKS
ncbi:Triple functional domain protein [Hypsibius exemplaris]|uniref:Triple functional domain protein n=1 Tax=Hypsibius exemplaris TaxID=2072580 RepID=A0A9X6RKJ9_HYPEX|nr:Triple functional domain protein [Hypsibius exemplaris]